MFSREMLKNGGAARFKKAEKGAVIPSRVDQCNPRALETASGSSTNGQLFGMSQADLGQAVC